MKKATKKLALKKVTLRNLDESTLDMVAGGTGNIDTCPATNCQTICGQTCTTRISCLCTGPTDVGCTGDNC